MDHVSGSGADADEDCISQSVADDDSAERVKRDLAEIMASPLEDEFDEDEDQGDDNAEAGGDAQAGNEGH